MIHDDEDVRGAPAASRNPNVPHVRRCTNDERWNRDTGEVGTGFGTNPWLEEPRPRLAAALSDMMN